MWIQKKKYELKINNAEVAETPGDKFWIHE